MESHIHDIASRFATASAISVIEPLGNGRINDTYLVRFEGSGDAFVLQRINSHVFPRPEDVMQNLAVFSQHANDRLSQLNLPSHRRWEIPDVLQARTDGTERPFTYDSDGHLWRALSFIANSTTVDTIDSVDRAKEVGVAVGIFHTLLSDLPGDRLADTLEGFHITPRYLETYSKRVAEGLSLSQENLCIDCLQFVDERREGVDVLEEAKAKGKLCLRPIHGDPKVNNILFDRQSDLAISAIDLDTVKPGLIHYDIGDCMRSGCNPAGSNAEDVTAVRFDLQNFQAILQGYCSVARQFLSDRDYEFLYDAIRLIPFELGLRYLTDYLSGNVYFKVSHPEQALQRARVQFALTCSIERQRDEIMRLIERQYKCDLGLDSSI